MGRRLEMFDAVQKSGVPLTTRIPYEILVLPLATRVIEDDENGLRHTRFLARLYNDDHPSLYTIGQRYFTQRGHRLEEMLYRALPHLPKDVVGMRATAATYAMINTLADLKRGPRPPYENSRKLTTRLLWQRVQTLIDFLTAAMEAPVSELSSDQPRAPAWTLSQQTTP